MRGRRRICNDVLFYIEGVHRALQPDGHLLYALIGLGQKRKRMIEGVIVRTEPLVEGAALHRYRLSVDANRPCTRSSGLIGTNIDIYLANRHARQIR